MGTKNNPGTFDCYEAAEPDEPMFVLLARDPQAPGLVRLWASQRFYRANRDKVDNLTDEIDKVNEAYKCAQDMENWFLSR